jgi:AcrR family transcriptional regulator
VKGTKLTPTSTAARRTRSEDAELGRQAQKSIATQKAVLEAAIRCLVALGYTNTTMESIAKSARISRGAIMHHYASRADVIAKTADYLANKRLLEFEAQVCAKLPSAAADEVGHASFRKAAELVMHYYELPSFTALHELLLAARTDKSISPLMRKVEKHINTRMLQLITQYLPYWEQLPAIEAVLTDLLHFVSRGVAMSHTNKLDRKRLDALLDLVSQVAYDQYRLGLKQLAD